MNYRIAKANDKDKLLDLILEFEKDEARYVVGEITDKYLESQRETIVEDIKNANYYVIDEGSELMGFCLVEKDLRNIKVARLIKLFIEPKFRSNGLGSKFVEFIENNLKISGVNKIWLLAHVKNSANEFYKKRKYKVMDHDWVKWEKEL